MALREDFEIRNCGRFKRIFPSDDRLRQDRYCKIMSSAFSVFLAGRGTSMQKEIQVNYNNKYRVSVLILPLKPFVNYKISTKYGE